MLDNLSLSGFKKFVQEIKFPGIEHRLQRFITEQRELKERIAALEQANQDLKEDNIRLANNFFKLDSNLNSKLLEVRRELRAEFSQETDG